MSAENNNKNENLLVATAMIVSALIEKGKDSSPNVHSLISDVYSSLARISHSTQVTGPDLKGERINIEDSVQPEYIVCLEDGKKLKMLKRYLMTNYHMTPEDYRKRWNLPANYPMVAPNYAEKRSALAKEIGLGKREIPGRAKKLAALSAAAKRKESRA